jgi:hypothetical protein
MNGRRQGNFDPFASKAHIRADVGGGLEIRLYTEEAHLTTAPARHSKMGSRGFVK